MEAPRDTSIGDILDRLLADRVIDACHMTNDYVTVVQGAKRHSFAYREARSFLLALLSGGSHAEDGGEPASSDDVMPLRAVDTSRPAERRFQPALDDLMRMAEELQIIEGHERVEEEPSIRLRLSSCETDMREAEAVAFLSECILFKLTEIRSDAAGTPWSAASKPNTA